MGCLISILCVIFFPVIYFWYQFYRLRKGMGKMMDEQMRRQRENGSSGSYAQGSDPMGGRQSKETTGFRKPHIIKPDEGEYIDFKEEKDGTKK